MRYYALATDYDGTIDAGHGVGPHVLSALRRVRMSGRRLVLVTGRRVEDLRGVFPEMDVFDVVVAENGGVLYWPDTRQTDRLAPSPSAEFLDLLRRRGVAPLVVGEVVLGTQRPNEHAVLDVIHDLALELQIVFNEDAVMVLPPGVSKGRGIAAALEKFGLTTHELVAVGNAANDHSFLDAAECSVAVADAAASIRRTATFTTRAPNGDGVVELIEELIATDLAARSPMGAGETVALGIDDAGDPVRMSPYGHNILVVGPSAAGKSTFATGLIERLMDLGYQLCVIDPEGDYDTVERVSVVGGRHHAPQIAEVTSALRDPAAHVVVNLVGVPLEERPHLAADLLSQIHAMRVSTGRPHWVVVDEVHHVLPSTSAHVKMLLPQRLGETILITMRATDVAPQLVQRVDVIVGVGPDPAATFADVAAALDVAPPKLPPNPPARGQSLIWFRTRDRVARRVSTIPGRSERRRHIRKYADGNLGARSFFFRGPEHRLNLRAQNLASFCNLMMGVDVGTFLYHLRRGDYEAWLRSVIKDDDLADAVRSLRESAVGSEEARRAIVDAIEERYVVGR